MINRIEDWRRWGNLIICWTAWLGVIGISAGIVFFSVPATTRWPTFAVIVLLGVGITASLTRSRYKLKDTIIEVFEAGRRAERARRHQDH